MIFSFSTDFSLSFPLLPFCSIAKTVISEKQKNRKTEKQKKAAKTEKQKNRKGEAWKKKKKKEKHGGIRVNEMQTLGRETREKGKKENYGFFYMATLDPPKWNPFWKTFSLFAFGIRNETEHTRVCLSIRITVVFIFVFFFFFSFFISSFSWQQFFFFLETIFVFFFSFHFLEISFIFPFFFLSFFLFLFLFLFFIFSFIRPDFFFF